MQVTVTFTVPDDIINDFIESYEDAHDEKPDEATIDMFFQDHARETYIFNAREEGFIDYF